MHTPPIGAAVNNAGTNTQMPTLQYSEEVSRAWQLRLHCPGLSASRLLWPSALPTTPLCLPMPMPVPSFPWRWSSPLPPAVKLTACIPSHTPHVQDYERIVGTNQEAVYFLCKYFHPLLKAAQGGSSIVFISSVAGAPGKGWGGRL